jgi:hypothetical protein
MYNPDTDLLFPPRILPALRDLRGITWRELVTSVTEAEANSVEEIAFVLMMARMNNCATCNSDSYRAMNGCTFCTKQSLKRFHESDHTLVEIFHTTKVEVENYLKKKTTLHQGDSLDRLQTMNR